VALVPLVPGEVVLASKLAPDGLRGAAALLPAGWRALAVPAGPGGRPPVAVGDHVDVHATQADGTSVVVAASAVVLAHDHAADALTVAVPADDAPALASAIATGSVTLALTGPG
jgi:Flp pilus assembly protein CpaB